MTRRVVDVPKHNRDESMKRLRTAEALLSEVARTLDTMDLPCGSCGLTHKRNWNEAQAYTALKGARERIRKATVLMGNPSDPKPGRVEDTQ